MGAYIPFPNVPDAPGVPPVPRRIGIGSSTLTVALGATAAVLARAVLQETQWGIFDQEGNQLGSKSISGVRIIDNVIEAAGLGATLSTLSVDYVKETRVSDFPIEAGSFASYNKVEMAAEPVVSLSLSGSEADRTDFLTALDAACKSTDLYNVVTPEVTYLNHSIERYVYRRSATRGATLIIVDVFLKEIRQVRSVYTQVQVTSAINQPKDPGATPAVNNGKIQPATPETSTLKTIFNKLGF